MSLQPRDSGEEGLKAMPVKRLDQATLRAVSKLLASETDDFNALVRLAGLDPVRDFRHTDMSGTSMAGADLCGFDFTGADFGNVNLDGATQQARDNLENNAITPGICTLLLALCFIHL